MDSRGGRPRDLVVSSKRTNGSARLFDGTHNLLGFWGWETSHASVSLRFTFDTSATCATSRALALRALVLKLSFPLGAAEEPILPLFPCPCNRSSAIDGETNRPGVKGNESEIGVK